MFELIKSPETMWKDKAMCPCCMDTFFVWYHDSQVLTEEGNWFCSPACAHDYELEAQS